MYRRVGALSVAAAITAIVVTGCSSGTAKVSKSEVEKQTMTQLTKTVGQAPDDVKCPHDLDAKVGSKMTCVLTKGSTSYDVAVTVASVKDDTAHFHIKVADHPK